MKFCRDAYIEMLEKLNPSHHLMLGGGTTDIAPITFDSRVRHFLNTCRRRAHGPNWAEREGAITALGFFERPVSGVLHIHLGVKAYEDDHSLSEILENGQSIWKKIRHSGDYYCEPVRCPVANNRYITKGFGAPQKGDNVFVYTSRSRVDQR